MKDGMKDVELERQIKALANRRRIAILRFLRKKKEAHVGAIADEIELSFKSTSNHLLILESAGLLNKEQRSTNMFYHLAPDAPRTLRAFLSIL